MPESLLSPSRIGLYGRVVEDLQIAAAPAGSTSGALEQQLRAEDACFARIYGFSYEGLYHVLPIPALFLVHGAGEAAGPVPPAAAPGGAHLPPEDLRLWTGDKGDYSMMLDLHSGTLEQLLLQAPAPDKGMSLRGMSLRGMSAPGPHRGDDKAD